MNVNLLEGFWFLVNLVTLVLTALAFLDARADRAAVAALNGRAREIAAAGLVRREGLRVIVQSLLLSVVVPSLFVPGDVHLSPPLLALILVPVVLLASSLLDARDRRAMTLVVAANLASEAVQARQRIEATAVEILEAIAVNTEISQKASDSAIAAYHEANSVNEKIALQGKELVIQGDALRAQGATRDADALRVEATIDDTHAKVDDLHDQLPGEP